MSQLTGFLHRIHMTIATWLGSTPQEPARLLKANVEHACDVVGAQVVRDWLAEWEAKTGRNGKA